MTLPSGPGRCGWPQAILFDLDGTLIDSAPDIAAAVNRVIAMEGLPPLTVEQVRGMIGNGVAKLVERAYEASAMPLEGERLADAVARMMAIYGDHLTTLTVLMPGALETVSAYAGVGVMVAIVSNKPMDFTRTIIDAMGFAPHAAAIQGAEDHLPKKPAPDMLFAALEKAGVHPGRALMVGDSAADVEAARAAGIPVVLVRGGYTSIPVEALNGDAVIDTLAGLPQAIERLKEFA